MGVKLCRPPMIAFGRQGCLTGGVKEFDAYSFLHIEVVCATRVSNSCGVLGLLGIQPLWSRRNGRFCVFNVALLIIW